MYKVAIINHNKASGNFNARMTRPQVKSAAKRVYPVRVVSLREYEVTRKG